MDAHLHEPGSQFCIRLRAMTPETPSDPELRFAWTAEGPFAYTDEGSGPTVLFVHGLPGSARDFRWLASALEGRVRSVRLEQPGFGATPVSTETGTSFDARARFVLAAADALDLDRFYLVGHSMGGGVAMTTAALAPERVSGLALLASIGMHPHRGARKASRRPDIARLLDYGIVRRALLPTMRAGFKRAGFPASTTDDAVVQSVRLFSALEFASVRRAAFALSAPAFIAWAEDDPLVETAIGLSLGAVLPDGPRISFESGGHNIQKTRAIELAEAMLTWIVAGVEMPKAG